jgi:hypothetical protein
MALPYLVWFWPSACTIGLGLVNPSEQVQFELSKVLPSALPDPGTRESKSLFATY